MLSVLKVLLMREQAYDVVDGWRASTRGQLTKPHAVWLPRSFSGEICSAACGFGSDRPNSPCKYPSRPAPNPSMPRNGRNGRQVLWGSIGRRPSFGFCGGWGGQQRAATGTQPSTSRTIHRHRAPQRTACEPACRRLHLDFFRSFIQRTHLNALCNREFCCRISLGWLPARRRAVGEFGPPR